MRKKVILLILFISNLNLFADYIISVSNKTPHKNDLVVLSIKYTSFEKEDYDIKGIENFKVISRVNNSSSKNLEDKIELQSEDIYILAPLVSGATNLIINFKNGYSEELAINTIDDDSNVNNENDSVGLKKDLVVVMRKEPSDEVDEEPDDDIEKENANEIERLEKIIEKNEIIEKKNAIKVEEPKKNIKEQTDKTKKEPLKETKKEQNNNIKKVSSTENIKLINEINKKNFYKYEKAIFSQSCVGNTDIFVFNYINNLDLGGLTFQNLASIDGDSTNNDKQSFISGVIFSNKSGNIEISGGRIEQKVDSNFVHADANSLTLKIMDLPKNVPENFQNVVGDLNVTYSYETEMKGSDEITRLDIKFFGNVNLDNINKIINSDVENFDVVETVNSFFQTIINNNYYAEKKFSIFLIPKEKGKFFTPEIIVPYFDINKKKYSDFRIKPIEINIKQQ